MAAPPNGRVGVGGPAPPPPTAPVHTGEQARARGRRTLPGRSRAPPGPAPLLRPVLSRLSPFSSPAGPPQGLAPSGWRTEELLVLSCVFGPGSAAPAEAASFALCFTNPLPPALTLACLG